MKLESRVFLDSNVFINGLIFPSSNSGMILELAEIGAIRPFVSTTVLSEVERFFREKIGRKEGYDARNYVASFCSVIPDEQAKKEMRKLKGKIKKKDLPNIAVTRKTKIKYLVSLDRDYKTFREYQTPKRFIRKTGLKPAKTEY